MNDVLERFYAALARRDWEAMGALYHADARFSDPVFPDLDAAGVRSLWRMLLSSGTDLRVTYRVRDERTCAWEAVYTFRTTGRPVHNRIVSRFTFRDGLILRQRDHFHFWRWARQALGPVGLWLGWNPLLRHRVRTTAATALARSRAR